MRNRRQFLKSSLALPLLASGGSVLGALSGAMARAGGENPGITMPVLSGPKANAGHALAGRRTILAGEQVVRAMAQAFGETSAKPDSELADNAQYWLAESYYVTQQFEQAWSSFQTVIDEHPRSRKVPDALLKMGYCNYELERWDAARAALSKVQADYPETTAARLAGQRDPDPRPFLGRAGDAGPDHEDVVVADHGQPARARRQLG